MECKHKYENTGISEFGWAIIIGWDILLFVMCFYVINIFKTWWSLLVLLILTYNSLPGNTTKVICRKCGDVKNI